MQRKRNQPEQSEKVTEQKACWIASGRVSRVRTLNLRRKAFTLWGIKKKSNPKPFDFELLAMPVVGVSRALSNSPQG